MATTPVSALVSAPASEEWEAVVAPIRTGDRIEIALLDELLVWVDAGFDVEALCQVLGR